MGLGTTPLLMTKWDVDLYVDMYVIVLTIEPRPLQLRIKFWIAALLTIGLNTSGDAL